MYERKEPHHMSVTTLFTKLVKILKDANHKCLMQFCDGRVFKDKNYLFIFFDFETHHLSLTQKRWYINVIYVFCNN